MDKNSENGKQAQIRFQSCCMFLQVKQKLKLVKMWIGKRLRVRWMHELVSWLHHTSMDLYQAHYTTVH